MSDNTAMEALLGECAALLRCVVVDDDCEEMVGRLYEKIKHYEPGDNDE